MFYSEVFYSELPSKNGVKAVRSCVDFVLPKLFKRITIAFELLRDGKLKIARNMGVYEKGIFGVAFRFTLLAGIIPKY